MYPLHIRCRHIYTALFVLHGALCQAAAAERQDLEQVRRTAEAYAIQIAGASSGTVSAETQALDQRVKLVICPKLEAFLPNGARAWGHTSIGVRCAKQWQVLVQTHIKVVAEVVIAARPLATGRVLRAEDISTQRVEITQNPAMLVVDPQEVLGRTLVQSIPGAQPLRYDMLRAPKVIAQGQPVRLEVQGAGFKISNEGVALGDAADGEHIQVRTNGGKVIKGRARRGGVVEVGA